MVLPESIRTIDVPDAEPGNLAALRIARAASAYLAARAAGAPGRTAPPSAVRFIPHTPEEAAAWRARKPSEPQTQRRPRAYTYRRSVADAYTPRRSSAETKHPIPDAAAADQVSDARKRRAGPRSRPATARIRHSARRSGRPNPESSRASAKPVKGRRTPSRKIRLRPDLTNLDLVIRQYIGL